MSAQFDLEQQILDAWKIIDDLDLYYHKMDCLDQDQSMNIILGLTELYRLKFERLFETFEKHLGEVHAAKIAAAQQKIRDANVFSSACGFDEDCKTANCADPFSVVDSLIKNSSEPLS
jgi:hypothetical protein